ncbi:homoserine kinase [Legionella fallonii]|uniref:Homoserine kinase n=1 Tax=Legionella fallonii LLAP-10 TaxID=1212491 RepID=A0A098G4U8_9GAMM|nr:homoserine kinase [Legionella fallonii]CEG56991.1 Homoserine kinase [Legionella fallonii LLAP-10]
MKKIKDSIQSIKAFAPATCANVAVGFDILGFAVDSIGDYVTLTKRDDQKIIIESIDSQQSLPFTSDKNTASVVLQKFCHDLDLEHGFSVHIKKGIPLCSGMGGSAASAVAALVACNAFLYLPLPLSDLARFALLGEEVASGEAHADNIIPCLFGGLTLIQSQQPMKILNLPIPDLYCVLIHPHLQVSTREARKTLHKELSLASHVQQSAYLASFIAALYEQDYSLLKQAMNDVIIEAQRAQFVPKFYEIKESAMRAGALGMSFSGSGPSLFAFARTTVKAKEISQAMQLCLQKNNIHSDCWISAINKNGARVVEEIL